MKRRKFIALIGLGALSRAAFGQQVAPHAARVGYLGPNPRAGYTAYDVFLGELKSLGYVEHENLSIEYRALGDDLASLSHAANELIQSTVDVLVADGPEAALRAVAQAGPTTPIVILAVNYDPVARGYIASLSRPKGNITGVVFRQPDLAEKQLELLKEAVPGAAHLAVLWDPISADQVSALEHGAQSHGLKTSMLKLEHPPYDFDATFRTLAAGTPDMLLVLSSPYFNRQREHLAQVAIEHRLPTMFTFQSYVEAGGLMFYGADNDVLHRRAANYVSKILKGARPSDLPVEQPSQLKLVINLKTAKALGITIPQSVVARADEVIE